jgi:DMSO reductase anchor subunit
MPGVESVPGFPETDARPSIRFEPLRPGPGPAVGGGARAVAVGGGAQAEAVGSDARRPPAKTTLRSEAPLVAFTLLAALAAGVMATQPGRAFLDLGSFLGLMALAGGASTLHLGRKRRAWRAVLNVRRSWLSREVALFTLFGALGALSLASDGSALFPALLPAWAPAGQRWLSTGAAAAGFALLFAVDRVYAVTRTRGLAFHSARALLTGVMVAGLAAGLPWLWGTAALAKGVSFGGRAARGGVPGPTAWVVVRLVPGLLLPAGVLLGAGPALPRAGVVACLALLALGEVVDRCAFYLELDVATPAEELRRALTAWKQEPAALEPA